MATAVDAWHEALQQSEKYWKDVQDAYEIDDQTVNTVGLPPEMHEWPSTRYEEFYAEVLSVMQHFIAEKHPIVTRMESLKPNRDMGKLIEWLVFWGNVYRGYTQPWTGDPKFQFGTDPVVMASSPTDLGHARDAMDAAMASVDLVITMDVALCLGMKWAIVIEGSHLVRSTDPPQFLDFFHTKTDITIDQFTEELWWQLIAPKTVPRLLKNPVRTRNELLKEYPFVNESFDPTSKPSKPSKPSQPSQPSTPSTGGSADSSLWILLLLLLVAGMYLYSK